jgi:hypothetical protein
MHCTEASAGIYEYKALEARLPWIHMAVYDTYIYNYQIYSNIPPQSQREHRRRWDWRRSRKQKPTDWHPPAVGTSVRCRHCDWRENRRVTHADGSPLCWCRCNRTGGWIAVVEDVVRRVAVVDVGLSRLSRIRSHTGSRGRSRGVVRTVARRGSHHGRRGRRVEAVEKGVNAEVDAVRSRRARRSRVCQARKCLGGRWHTPVLPIPDVGGRVHHQVSLSEGPAEKASTTVAGAKCHSKRC